MSLFGGLFVFCNDFEKGSFFSLISTDVISQTTKLCFLFAHSLYLLMAFCLFVWEQLVLRDFEWCIRGRVVTISDLKEVLKAKTEAKDRQKGCAEENYSWEHPVRQQ